MTAPGSVTLIADIYPASIIDSRTGTRPEGVPARTATKLRVILSTTEIVVAWAAGTGQVGHLTIPVTEEDTAAADHNGGEVGPYVIKRAGGCSCDKMLKRWSPYSGVQIRQAVRTTPSRFTEDYGLPQKYTRR